MNQHLKLSFTGNTNIMTANTKKEEVNTSKYIAIGWSPDMKLWMTSSLEGSINKATANIIEGQDSDAQHMTVLEVIGLPSPKNKKKAPVYPVVSVNVNAS